MKKLRKYPRLCVTPRPVERLEQRAYLTAISFANHTDFSAGTAPVAIVAADFNNDHKMDIATIDEAFPKVNIFFGNGDGTFTTGPVLPLSGTPTSLVVGDFNHDGFPDLAVGAGRSISESGTTVTVFLNNQEGNFGTGQITTVTSNAAFLDPLAITTGDFDGDGNLDIATANYAEGTVSVLLGTGTGSFQTPVTYTVGQNPTSIVSGHFNSTSSLDLAVADARGGTGSLTQVFTLLDGTGTGTFNAGPDVPVASISATTLTTTDFNGDGLTDIVVGGMDSTIQVFQNAGADQFTSEATISTSGPVSTVAVADFNFDGILDIAAAQGGSTASPGNSNVSIATGLGTQTYSTIFAFPTGADPVGMVVADFNGDNKPDIATANPDGGTVSILLNTVAGTPQKATTTALTTNLAMAPFGTNVELTATITGPAGAGFPTGDVNFYQGSTLLGTAAIGASSDTAVFSSTTLGVGTDMIIARYQGDGTFSPSASTALSETITPIAGEGPDLIATFISTKLPSEFVPGEKAAVKFRITNQGNFAGKGLITNNLYLSLDDTLDSGDIPITITGSLAKANVNLAVGKSIVLSGNFTIPADTSLGNYVLLLNANVNDTLLESDTTNNTGVSPTTLTAVDAFGTVGGRRNVTLLLADPNGTQVTYKLNGPGTGTVNVGDDGIDITVIGTTLASALTFTGKGGNGFVTLNNLAIATPIGSVTGLKTNFGTNVTLSGGVTRLSLNNFAGGSSLVVGTGPTPSIKLGDLSGVALTAATGIKSLAVRSVVNDVTTPGGSGILPDLVNLIPSSIAAPWIGTLSSAGQFQTSLSLSGATSPRGISLLSANIGGTLGPDSIWSITGNVGKLALNDATANAGAISVAGQVKSFTEAGDFGGDIGASSFGSILIKGDLSGDILAGANFGANGVLGGGDDSFVAGSIASLKIGGTATATAIVAAGLNPVDDILLNGNDTLLAGGQIVSLTVGAADPASRFLAAIPPAKPRIAGQIVDPASDQRFNLDPIATPGIAASLS